MPSSTSSPWRSKFFASGGLFLVLASTAAALFDDNPATNPDYVLVGGALAGFLGFLFIKPPGQ